MNVLLMIGMGICSLGSLILGNKLQETQIDKSVAKWMESHKDNDSEEEEEEDD